jgi:hypothetical protein
MVTESKPVPRRKAPARSRVTNGNSLFVDGVDARTAAARRFADLVAEIVSDLGEEGLSEGQRQLARRAALIATQCELIEAEAIAGTLSDERLEAYGKLTDRLGRCFQRLGLKRKARDITPDLTTYLKSKASQ